MGGKSSKLTKFKEEEIIRSIIQECTADQYRKLNSVINSKYDRIMDCMDHTCQRLTSRQERLEKEVDKFQHRVAKVAETLTTTTENEIETSGNEIIHDSCNEVPTDESIDRKKMIRINDSNSQKLQSLQESGENFDSSEPRYDEEKSKMEHLEATIPVDVENISTHFEKTQRCTDHDDILIKMFEKSGINEVNMHSNTNRQSTETRKIAFSKPLKLLKKMATIPAFMKKELTSSKFDGKEITQSESFDLIDVPEEQDQCYGKWTLIKKIQGADMPVSVDFHEEKILTRKIDL